MKTISWALLILILFASPASASDQCPNNKEVKILRQQADECSELLGLDRNLSPKEKAYLQATSKRSIERAQELCEQEKESRKIQLRMKLLGKP